MNKICVWIICLVLCGGISGYAQSLDDAITYVLKLPKIAFESRDQESKNLRSYEVKVSHLDEDTFLLRPVSEGEWWVKSLQERDVRGWIGRVTPNGGIEISGIMGNNDAYSLVELMGTFLTADTITGQAIFRIGFDVANAPFVYHGEWGLTVREKQAQLDISHTVTYHGPSIPVTKLEIPSPWEEAQYPVNTDRGIKRFARHSSHDRAQFYKGLPVDSKAYYDTLLTELAWEEIVYMPGILLLIDHLITVDDRLKQKIAEGSVRDGSLHFFDPIPFTDLQQFPPLFLILYAFNKMPEKDREGLQQVSPRFATMSAAYKAIPIEEVSGLSVLEFMVKVSEKLPEDFRKTYYQQSPKLRNYVASSGDDRLKALYPF